MEKNSSKKNENVRFSGEQLRKLLKENGMTQKELAEKSDYTPQAVNRIIQGKVRLSREAAHAFAEALDVDEKYLLQEQDVPRMPYTQEEIFHELFEKNDFKQITLDDMINELPENELTRLLFRYTSLNENGRKEARRLLELLIKVPEYRRYRT